MKHGGLLRTVILLLLPTVSLLSLGLGSVNLGLGRIIDGLAGLDPTASAILIGLRLPRVLGALLAGAGLATAGLLLQTVTDNELCAPNIIGVNSGAGLAVMVFTALFPSAWRLTPLAAFVGALIATCAVLLIARFAGGLESRSTLVLSGVAVSSVMSAGISYLSVRFPDALVSYTGFTVGGFGGVTLDRLAIPSVVIALGLGASLALSSRLGLLRLGDDAAISLGVRVKPLRLTATVIASALCAAVVSYAGLLGFVGLIVPHISRRLAGSGMIARLGCSVGVGATLTVLSDLAGRLLLAPSELPAGVIMSLAGAPFFVFLLIRRRD